jgi:dolichol-phosphate mannosyltransferase
VLAQLEEYDYEILFVDDDSSDTSLEILERHAESDTRIKVVATSRRFGLYPCLIAGLRHASGDAVIYVETDLQDPPELMPALVEKWEAGADVVYTSRTKRLGETKFKMLVTRLAYKAINLAGEIAIPENSGDYKLLSRRVVDQVLALTEQDPYFRGMVSWVGFKQTQVFYERQARFRGKSKQSLLTLLPVRTFLSAILSLSNKPLYSICVAGVMFSALAIWLVLYAILWSSISADARLLLVVVIIMLCILQLSLGIQALYLARIYGQVRNRPLYVIRKRIGFRE